MSDTIGGADYLLRVTGPAHARAAAAAARTLPVRGVLLTKKRVARRRANIALAC